MPVVRALVGLISAIRWIWFPAAVFAVVALGIHAGADVLDDTLLAVLDRIDGWIDRAISPPIRWLWLTFGASEAKADAAVVRACELIDLEERTLVAQWLAIGLELLCDLFVVRLLLATPQPGPQRRAPLLPLPPPNVLWQRLLAWAKARAAAASLRSVLAPAMILAASIAGACAVAEALQSELFGLLRRLLPATVAAGVGRLAAVMSLGAVLILFATPAVLRVARSAPPILTVHPWQARLAGWRTLLLLAPVSLAAFIERAPLLSFFR